jgi:hypothetical protein
MADGRLDLEPGRALFGARNLTAAGKDLGALRSGPGAELAATSTPAPWGDDEIGHAFESRYRPVEIALLNAWQALATHIETLGELGAQTVGLNAEADQEAAYRVTLTEKRL